MRKCAIVWFRNDLRVHDHEPLAQAAASGLPVVGLYCFDPRQYGKTAYGFPKTGRHRARFIRESVAVLRTNLNKLGIPLLVRQGRPEEVLTDISASVAISELHYHHEWGSEEREAVRFIHASHPFIRIHVYYGHNLIHPEDLPIPVKDMPVVYSMFRRRVEGAMPVRTMIGIPAPATNHPGFELEEGELPSDNSLGITAEACEPAFRGGSHEGRQRLRHYFFDTGRLRVYKDTRNGLLHRDDTSKLSPYLAHGCLSPRYVYEQVKAAEAEWSGNDSTRLLVAELLWRDYFWLLHGKLGNRIFSERGLTDYGIPWSRDERLVDAWLNGRTGYPLVDACMTELRRTGFLSNRGRQNVASFLTKNLGVDWRIGAEWFESCLIDYDVSLNYGNWCYCSGVGTDHMPYRVFNVMKQGREYDPYGQYAKRWLPMLRDVPAEQVYEVHELTLIEQAACGIELGTDYPYPIVDLSASARDYKDRLHKAMNQ
ncbi:DASH family cryptochrome [Paenibacillus chungangensis]|uniref:Cryptochrome DASH n=1 Tax=Paenibacillus chungangensis TaxID=696535 RepID=A0ABW3HP44_9BACL